MIVSAACIVYSRKQHKQIVVPCHQHPDVNNILSYLGLKNVKDYLILEQGFLNHDNHFLSREQATTEAVANNQLKPHAIILYNNYCEYYKTTTYPLHSCDLW